MKFKRYLRYVAAHIPTDSEKPTDIVQMLACLIASRLSRTNKLPVSCGRGNELDMDIVQAGILAGLQRLEAFDSTKGTLKQYLYQRMAGEMFNYAWKRENRVADALPDELPSVFSFYDEGEDPKLLDEEGDEEALPAQLLSHTTPETEMAELDAAKEQYEALQTAIGGLGKEGTAMLLRDVQIGYNAAARQAWADEIGVSVGALSMRLARLRRDARDWALTVQ